MKYSDKPLLKETMGKLQLLLGIEPHPQRWESTIQLTQNVSEMEVAHPIADNSCPAIIGILFTFKTTLIGIRHTFEYKYVCQKT